MFKTTLFFIGFFFSLSYLVAQSSELRVTEIEISGNKWTRDFVVLRELNFEVDSKGTQEYFEEVKAENVERLKSLGLFNDVVMEFIPKANEELVCSIALIENWYIYPGLIFELADRNFSDWWVNQNHDISRVNYGVRLEHINTTGARDKLIAQFQRGFRKKYELVYKHPYLSKDGKWGSEAFVFFANQDQIAYKTENNRTIYGAFEERTLINRFRSGAAVFYRPSVYFHHALRFEYHKNSVDDYVIEELNSKYFLNGRNSIQFFYLNYFFTYDRRISQFYPIGGYMMYLDIKKEGLGYYNEYNNTSIAIGAEAYHAFNEKLIFGSKLKLKANIDRSEVSFANNTGLGWRGDDLTAYSLYVIDGTDFVYLKNNLSFRFYSDKFNFGKWMPLTQFKVMNIQMFARGFLETGYVNDPTYRKDFNNTFSNRWLLSYGPALDIILYNNYMGSFNFGFNHLNEFSYVFQFRTSF